MVVTTSSVITNGNMPTMALWTMSGILWLREKMMTNENKYKASGSTHKSGTGVMSVVMNAVTPSIMLEGTNANPIQRKRLSSVGLAESPATRESPKAAAPVSGAPPPAATGGLGDPSTAKSSSCVVAVADEERHSITIEANTSTTETP